MVYGYFFSYKLVPFLISSLFFILGYRYLGNGFPAEDALILYRYAENLAYGNVISFNLGGAAAEGATDFLWMVALSLCVWLGIDIAIASLLLNSVGAYIVSFLFLKMLVDSGCRETYKLVSVTVLLASFLVFSNVAFAAYLGFSTVLYTALIFSVYYLAYLEKKLSWGVLYAVTILFRPDAVLLLSGSFLYVLYRSYKNRMISDVFYMAIPTVVGVVYFLWRWSYFGNFLPLPLYVKSVGGSSVLGNLKDYLDMGRPSFFFIIFPAFFLFVKNYRYFIGRLQVSGKVFFSLIILVLFVYMVTMVSGHKSQNIYNRYEVPFFIFYFSAFLLIVTFNGASKSFLVSVTALYFISSIVGFSSFQKSYHKIDDFTKVALSLREGFASDVGLKFALTEAGNLPYWNDGFVVYDLAGLNTDRTALSPVNASYLEAIAPDLIELDVHNEKYFFRSRFIDSRGEKCGISDFHVFYEFRKPQVLEEIEKYSKSGLPTTHVALINTVSYLSKRSDFSDLRVFYTQKRDQIYIYDRKSDYAEVFEEVFRRVCSDRFKESYLHYSKY